MTDDKNLRVLIADDHPMFRDGLAALLGSTEGFEVVGLVASGAEAVSSAGELQPDVIVMDLKMPDVDGIEATRSITRTSPHIGILVVTMFDDDDSVFAAMRAGARGYILKGADQNEILRALQAVGRGEAIFGAGVAQRVIAYFSAARRGVAPSPFPELTERELEVLDLAAAGINNQSIARRLHISDKTVRNHVSNIFAKLQVADRAEMIVRAREAGLGEG